MQDGILKGTGNSRYLKSIADFLTQYPTYEDMVAALVAGTLPIDLDGINTAGWSQVPTYLNKANLLSDTTETAIWGSTGNRTVDAAVAELNALIENVQTGVNRKVSVKTGSYSTTQDSTITVTVGSRPKLVLVSSNSRPSLANQGYWAWSGVSDIITITSTGFTHNAASQISASYKYIALY